MTVTELRELLQDLEVSGKGDLEVVFSYNYGDHWKTEVAEFVADAMEGTVAYSDYHNMHKVIEESDSEENVQKVIVLI